MVALPPLPFPCRVVGRLRREAVPAAEEMFSFPEEASAVRWRGTAGPVTRHSECAALDRGRLVAAAADDDEVVVSLPEDGGTALFPDVRALVGRLARFLARRRALWLAVVLVSMWWGCDGGPTGRVV